MKVILISTDRAILKEGSAVRARMVEYGRLFEELHIILFTKWKKNTAKTISIAGNVSVYPTNSLSKFTYVSSAVKIGNKILRKGLNTPTSGWVVSAQDPFETGLSGYRISKRNHIPLQLQIHTDLFSPYFVKFSLINKARVSLARFLLPKADGVRVVSKRIADSLAEEKIVLKSDPVVLPIFTQAEDFLGERNFELRAQFPQFNFLVLMMSRLEKEKDIPLALQAFSLVVKEKPLSGLMIVGSGSQNQSLHEQVEKLGLSRSVVFVPETKEPREYYKIADLFLCISLFEGYGLVLAEAAYSGLPIVSTDVGIAKELSATIAEHSKESVAEKILLAINQGLPNPLPLPQVSKRDYLERYESILKALLPK